MIDNLSIYVIHLNSARIIHNQCTVSVVCYTHVSCVQIMSNCVNRLNNGLNKYKGFVTSAVLRLVWPYTAAVCAWSRSNRSRNCDRVTTIGLYRENAIAI